MAVLAYFEWRHCGPVANAVLKVTLFFAGLQDRRLLGVGFDVISISAVAGRKRSCPIALRTSYPFILLACPWLPAWSIEVQLDH